MSNEEIVVELRKLAYSFKGSTTKSRERRSKLLQCHDALRINCNTIREAVGQKEEKHEANVLSIRSRL